MATSKLVDMSPRLQTQLLWNQQVVDLAAILNELQLAETYKHHHITNSTLLSPQYNFKQIF